MTITITDNNDNKQMKMKINNFRMYLDGGTIKLQTDKWISVLMNVLVVIPKVENND